MSFGYYQNMFLKFTIRILVIHAKMMTMQLSFGGMARKQYVMNSETLSMSLVMEKALELKPRVSKHHLWI